MISFFRRALSSWIVLGFLGLIMIAFVITGVGTPGAGGGTALFGEWVVKIGGQRIAPEQAEQRMRSALQAARQQNASLELPAFIAQGGFDRTIDQMINTRAFQYFAEGLGMTTSRRMVDGEIASLQAFKGPTGSFDRATFLNVIAQAGLNEDQVREDIARDKLVSALIIPAQGGARASARMSALYASLLLEARTGEIATIPSSVVSAVGPPSDAELKTFYQRNAIRYTVPETRVLRYALFDRSQFADKVQISDAEIAAAYKADSAKYAAKATRVFTQVVVPDQKTAQTIATRARSGTSLADAAKAARADAVKLAEQDESSFAGLTSAATAKAAFAAAKGAILDPQKSPFGWHVIRVDAINTTAGQSLDSVRPQLIEQIRARKMDGALAEFVTKLEDEIADGGTFESVAKANGLAIVSIPAVTSSGLAPDQPNFRRDSAILPVLKDAFQAQPDDDPSVVTLIAGRAYAFYDLDKINPAAPRPLSSIKQQVVADFQKDRAAKAARKIADAVAAKVNGGATLAAAVAGAGVSLPAVRPISARRIELARGNEQVPPPVALLFSMARGKAKILPMPDDGGWFVVNVTGVTPGDPRTMPGLIEQTQQELAATLGEEYTAQLASAIRNEVGIERNEDALRKLKRRLTGAPVAR